MASPTETALPSVAELKCTLQDVAREAGVSLATVDRALNLRPGVSAATLLRVREAVQRLTRRRQDDQAAQRQPVGRLLCFLLPSDLDDRVGEIRAALDALGPWLAQQHARVEVRCTDACAPAAAAAAVRRLRGQYDAVVLMLRDDPLVSAAVQRLVADGTCVVTLIADLAARRDHYVGIDPHACGRTAATLLGRFTGARSGTVGIVSGPRSIQDHGERLAGFRQALLADHPRLALLPPLACAIDPAVALHQLAEWLAARLDLVGLYSVDDSASLVHRALKQAGAASRLAWVCHELGPASRAALLDGTASAVVGQSVAQEVHAACRLALARLKRQSDPAAMEAVRIEIYLKDNLP